MDIEEWRPPNTSTDVWLCTFCHVVLSLAVVLPTPHDYSGTIQGGYSARFIASRGGFLREQEGFCTLQKQPRERWLRTLQRQLKNGRWNCRGDQ